MFKQVIKQFFPNQFQIISDWNMYRRVTNQLENQLENRNEKFKEMVERSLGKKSLQIGVRKEKYAPHWTSVDLYDEAHYIDYHYDVQDMGFENESFEFVVCNAVLEHIPYPQKAIAEFWRVLKFGGEVWIEVPFNQPYHPHPGDFWRVSHEGMRIWMADFDEQAIGLFSPHNNSIYNAIYYHGIKKVSE